ncbi:hypothetical protein CBR_g17788 [Chara braunii]|uniref:HP domain-containing protein n=1 Tax=Chara braunii TaxID=69332 RepID=A0A388KVL3_CHABU|nr:hypothetical protein CBR_g17788 [Chara braunii]|eukprot:GBG74077.1 hypothetical protein CBR_g17788 [Chara braunii]
MSKDVDPAFQGAGQKAGLEVWRIENFKPAPLDKENYGKFYSGDSYIVLKTTEQKGGKLSFTIHFWLGKDTTQDEAATAAIKVVELDGVLNGRAIQYRECQGHESDLFLSYFKPCFLPLEGGIASGFTKVSAGNYAQRLFQIKGKRTAHVRQVPFNRNSLNHSDVFVLDTEHKIFQFNGAQSTKQERVKAMEVAQFLKDTNHKGGVQFAMIEDGKLGDEADAGEFWLSLGGFAPIPMKKTGVEEDQSARLESLPPRLVCVAKDSSSRIAEGTLQKDMLDSTKCYVIDCGSEIYVWTGKNSALEDRKAANAHAEAIILKDGRPSFTPTTAIAEGLETPMFKSHFGVWISAEETAKKSKTGRVAAMLAQQGLNVKGLVKGPAPVPEEEGPPMVDVSMGKLQVWRIDGSKKVKVPSEDHGKFYSGDCYLVLFTYNKDRRDEYLLFFWLGRNRTMVDQNAAAQLAKELDEALQGRAVQVRIVQGKEPHQFISLFRGNMIVFKGGLSSSYKEQVGGSSGGASTAYSSDTLALFQVRGTTAESTRVVQVDPVARSLNSMDCFILQTQLQSMYFVWFGSFSSEKEQKASISTAERLRPGAQVKGLKEGSEPPKFWEFLGGKAGYPNTRETTAISRDARLFVCSNVTTTMKVEEIHNFVQDDLLSEDIMILDTFTEVFVWIGHHAPEKAKKMGLEIAQKYLEMVVLTDGRSSDSTIVKVSDGSEPPMFTCHFTWDNTKSATFVDPYDRMLALLQGRKLEPKTPAMKGSEVSKKRIIFASPMLSGAPSPAFRRSPYSGSMSNVGKTSPYRSGMSQHAAALAALQATPIFKGTPSLRSRSGRGMGHTPSPLMGSITDVPDLPSLELPPSAVAAEDAAEAKKAADEILGLANSSTNATEASANGGSTEPAVESTDDTGEVDGSPSAEGFYKYEALKVGSKCAAKNIDVTKRESYLSDEDFKKLFEMDKKEFYSLAKWKQAMRKKAKGLF